MHYELELATNKTAITILRQILDQWRLCAMGGQAPFEVKRAERMAANSTLGFPNRQIANAKRLLNWGFQETLIGWSVLLLIGCYLIVQIFGVDVGAENLWTEFWGLIFDILIILVGFGLIQNWKQRRDDIARQEEIIEDLKRWDNEESMHRVVGAIRRLNLMGQTAIDLTGAALSNAQLKGYGVSSLRGSKLSGGGWADETVRESAFKNVDFSRLDLRDAVFGKPAWFGATKSGSYVDCDFFNADLQNAVFDAAELHWTTPPPNDLHEVADYDEDGRPYEVRIHYAGFNDADLANTSFKKCSFLNADFREAFNLETADFSGASGLETCWFDSDELKAQIIAKASEPKK